MTSLQPLTDYLAWQKEMGGEELVLEEGVTSAIDDFLKKAGRRAFSPESKSKPSVEYSRNNLTETFEKLIQTQTVTTKTGADKSTKPTASKLQRQIPEFNSLDALYRFLSGSELYREHAVIKATGNPAGALAVVTMLPTEVDVQSGYVLQGKEGDLFEKMLDYIGMKRGDVYCTSILKSCDLYNTLSWRDKSYHRQLVEKELSLTNSRAILLFGEKCGQLMLKSGKSMEELRNSTHAFSKNDILNGRRAVVTYHPRQLINTRNLKYAAKEDLQWIQEILSTPPKG